MNILLSLLLVSSASAFSPSWNCLRNDATTTTPPTAASYIETIAFVRHPTALLGSRQAQKWVRKQEWIKARATSSPAVSQTMLQRDHDPIKIIIAGAPASGKGTQCEKLKAKYGMVHLSTGDMLREAVLAGTEVGIQAKEYMDAGKLVPDAVIIGIIMDRLQKDDCKKNGWLLDGFPRTHEQAKALEAAGAAADCFLFLHVPDEKLVERVVGRRTDPESGKIYHMTFSPPNDETILARLEQRSDDTEDKVKVRLEQFHANVDAVKGSYTEISVTINGDDAPDVVSTAIFEAVEQRVRGKIAA